MPVNEVESLPMVGRKLTRYERVCMMLESYEFDKLCGPLRQEIACLRAHHAVCMQFKEELNLVLETNGVVCGVGRNKGR